MHHQRKRLKSMLTPEKYIKRIYLWYIILLAFHYVLSRWGILCPSDLLYLIGSTTPKEATSAGQVRFFSRRFSSRLAVLPTWLHRPYWIRWLPGRTLLKIPQECLAHSIWDIQAILWHVDWQLHQSGLVAIPEAQFWQKGHPYSWGWGGNRQRCLIDSLLFSKFFTVSV